MLSFEEIPEIFSDLTPIPQNDGPDRVCVIQYPSSFTLAYNYMRAVWAAKELSGTCVRLCPSSFGVHGIQLIKRVLFHLSSDNDRLVYS